MRTGKRNRGQLTGEVMLNTQTYVPLLLLKSILKSCSIFFPDTQVDKCNCEILVYGHLLFRDNAAGKITSTFLC